MTPRFQLLLRTAALSSTSLLLLPLAAQAAGRTDLHNQDVPALNRAYRIATANAPASKANERHAELVGLDSESALTLLNSSSDANGTVHYRYQQTFRGLPVFGEHVVVAEDARGNVTSLFGRRVDRLSADLPANQARIARETAQTAAERAWLASKPGRSAIRSRDAQLVVYVDGKGRAHEAYATTFFAEMPGGRGATQPTVIVDARSGKVLNAWEGLNTAQVGTGPGGNVKTGQYEWGTGGYYGYLDVGQAGSVCTMENADVRTVNLNGATTGLTPWSYTCPRNTTKPINGAYAPLNDAHYFGGVVQRMYQAYTGEKALSIQLVMRAHYGVGVDNAYWDSSEKVMNFGDGATLFHPLVSTDIAAHEVSHGYTQAHSNLTYIGQSGGINEAFSDIAGEAAEFFWKGSNDFLVGAEVWKSGTALRYMANPPLDGHSISNVSEYTTDYWTCDPIGVFFCPDGYEKVHHDGTDVHYSSGIYNKAFYTLATNPTWGTVKAFQVFARANKLYWTPSTDFNQGVCGVQAAASDLGYSWVDVATSFEVVGAACATSQPMLSVDDVSITEGNSGTKLATFTVRLSKAWTAPVSVTVSTSNGTAYDTSDYVARTAVVQVPAGQLTGTFAVTIAGDTTVESNETFAVNLSGAANAGIRDAQGLGTIVNDDLPSLTVSDVSIAEGASGISTATFNVNLSYPATSSVAFNVATSNGTATAGSDYVAVNRTGQLIDAGRSRTTVTVTINGDTTREGNETFFVNVSGVTGAVVADGVGQGTILNDD